MSFIINLDIMSCKHEKKEKNSITKKYSNFNQDELHTWIMLWIIYQHL